jgi:spore coat polysaccharide biosynthesis predicted glycosyltransferase SpsG
VVVVDAYSMDAERTTIDATALVAVDDLGRDLAVDLVVDPNPGPAPQRRRAGRVMQGVEFALIGPIPDAVRRRPVTDRAASVLVTTGASDDAGSGHLIAERVHALRPDLEVRLVVGPWSRPGVPHGVVVVEQPRGLWSELAAADIVVTAGGVTLLEACALARPTIAMATAANQQRNVAGAVAAGAAVGVGSPDDAADAVAELAGDPPARLRLQRAAEVWVDGCGPDRVAEAVLALA